jgi:two-component system, OmpR family, sensor histidine kinase BaeS
MNRSLLWKLLLINLPVIGTIVLVIRLAIDHLAANYFMVLMDEYMVAPTETHQAFLDAIHFYLIWATLAGLALALLLSYLLTRRVLRPLARMTEISGEVASGNFAERVDVSSRDEVGQLGLAFNRMADSLSRLEQLRRNMVSDVAHELRTPLTNLRGYLEALSDEVVPPSKQTFDMLQQEILRLVHLVEDLQQLTKAEAAGAYLNRQNLSLPEIVGQMLDLYRPVYEAREQSVETCFAPEASQVSADRDKLLQAIRNLIDNACRYAPPGSMIRIDSQREDGTVRVIFSNGGPPIPDEALPFLFQRFYRADPSRSREAGGAGIGLSIVKGLIEAHGGTVGAESDPSATRIWFTLPA